MSKEYNAATYEQYQKFKWPYVKQWYGVSYPDINRVVRVADAETAFKEAESYPDATAVVRSVSDWLPLQRRSEST